MKKNDFPTNPIAFAQYVWENIEVGDTLVDRFHNFWKVASLTIYEGRKIRIYIRYIGSESYTNYNNGDFKKLTRYDLASKYYFYINIQIRIKITIISIRRIINFKSNKIITFQIRRTK